MSINVDPVFAPFVPTYAGTQAIKHKLLTAKLLVLDISNGDVVTEQTFVDVLDMRIVRVRGRVTR